MKKIIVAFCSLNNLWVIPSSKSVLGIFSLNKKTTPSVEYLELELVPLLVTQ